MVLKHLLEGIMSFHWDENLFAMTGKHNERLGVDVDADVT